MPERLFRCPASPVTADDGWPLIGCGQVFVGNPDDEGEQDGSITCPHCGMWFDPDHPENINEQPEATDA